jgi:hypothetical protein
MSRTTATTGRLLLSALGAGIGALATRGVRPLTIAKTTTNLGVAARRDVRHGRDRRVLLSIVRAASELALY